MVLAACSSTPAGRDFRDFGLLGVLLPERLPVGAGNDEGGAPAVREWGWRDVEGVGNKRVAGTPGSRESANGDDWGEDPPE